MTNLTKSQRRAMIACESRMLPAGLVDQILKSYGASTFRGLTNEQAEELAREMRKHPTAYYTRWQI